MENASKALVMAASILLGVMIISVGVALFKSFGGSGAQIIGEIERAKTSEFNNQFLKYYGLEDGLSGHDVVTIINLAKENNESLGISDVVTKNENSQYIQIDLEHTTNLEKKSEQELIDMFMKPDIVYDAEDKVVNPYDIKEVELNPHTKRIIYIKLINR